MGNNEFRKETVEIVLNNERSNKSQGGSGFYDRMKNGLGVASAGAWKAAKAALRVKAAGMAIQSELGIRGVEGFSASGSRNELQTRGNDHPSNVPEYFTQQEHLV